MIYDSIDFRKELEKTNGWWTTEIVNEVKRYPFKREIFPKLKEELENRRIIILLGPRRVGKSVLLKQLIDFLIQHKTTPSSILYYSMDDPSLYTYCDNPIKDIIDYFEENISQGGRNYIFLDEIHSSSDWHKWIKSYYDRYPSLKFILSGSSSLTLQKEANKYLRGRTIEFELYPLNLKEFLELSNCGQINFPAHEIDKIPTRNINQIWHKIKKPFNEYLLVGGFPEWFEMKKQKEAIDQWFARLINDIPKRAIYEDTANLFGVKNPRVLELIFTFICFHQSQILAYETINEIGNLDRLTLVNYIEFLKNSYLLVEVMKFAKLKEQIKSRKKYLIIDQGIRNALLKDYQIKEENSGFIVENLVGVKCFQQEKKNGKVFYWKNNGEVDFVIQNNKQTLPVEVKYKNRILLKELSGILNFMNKFKIKKGKVITKDLYKKEKIEGNELLFLPAWVFLLAD